MAKFFVISTLDRAGGPIAEGKTLDECISNFAKEVEAAGMSLHAIANMGRPLNGVARVGFIYKQGFATFSGSEVLQQTASQTPFTFEEAVAALEKYKGNA